MMLTWVALAITFVVACTAALSVYKVKKHFVAAQQQLEQQVDKLKHELSVVNNASVGVGRHLMMAEKKLAQSIEKQQQLEITTTDYLPYRQATDLVEKGASAEELVDQCGLPSAEANLMTLVQRAANK